MDVSQLFTMPGAPAAKKKKIGESSTRKPPAKTTSASKPKVEKADKGKTPRGRGQGQATSASKPKVETADKAKTPRARGAAKTPTPEMSPTVRGKLTASQREAKAKKAAALVLPHRSTRSKTAHGRLRYYIKSFYTFPLCVLLI